MLTVGQDLWYVESLRHRPLSERGRVATVVKVGRKWAQLDGNLPRIDVKTMVVDSRGYSSPGRCWLSKEDWETELRIDALWRRFHGKLYVWSAPSGVTEDAILRAADILGIHLT